MTDGCQAVPLARAALRAPSRACHGGRKLVLRTRRGRSCKKNVKVAPAAGAPGACGVLWHTSAPQTCGLRMIDHTGVKVSDLARSTAFYRAALAPSGYRLLLEFPAAVTGAEDVAGGRD